MAREHCESYRVHGPHEWKGRYGYTMDCPGTTGGQAAKNVLSNVGIGLLIAFTVAGFVGLPLWVVAGVASNFVVAPYENAVGSHIDAAIASGDPDGIIRHIDEAEAGIAKLGLTADSKAAPYGWKDHYGCSVQFAIDNWESAKDLAKDAKKWKQRNADGATDHNANTYVGELGEVHHRLSSDVGCDSAAWWQDSDGNVYNAWLAKEHPFIFFMRYWVFVFLLGFAASFVVAAIINDC